MNSQPTCHGSAKGRVAAMSCWASACLRGSRVSWLYNQTLVSMAFMKLVTRGVRAGRAERRRPGERQELIEGRGARLFPLRLGGRLRGWFQDEDDGLDLVPAPAGQVLQAQLAVRLNRRFDPHCVHLRLSWREDLHLRVEVVRHV